MCKIEVTQFYINAKVTTTSITNKICEVHIEITPDLIVQVPGVPHTSWKSYVRNKWPPLDRLSSALAITKKFDNNPSLQENGRIEKRAMIKYHKLLFEVVHKMVIPRWEYASKIRRGMDWPMGSGWVNYLSMLSYLSKFGRLTKDVIGEVNQVGIPTSSRGFTTLI
ncbi:hypothetical protein HAX54_028564 [Datura stramonium]|uniref:Uncharacterized protein n=1 Tax=Datura stramonium TaxID=4076 RepID=A0ABS8S9P3_DATST|nr:hypothetical protein [Datura stramonium]